MTDQRGGRGEGALHVRTYCSYIFALLRSKAKILKALNLRQQARHMCTLSTVHKFVEIA